MLLHSVEAPAELRQGAARAGTREVVRQEPANVSDRCLVRVDITEPAAQPRHVGRTVAHPTAEACLCESARDRWVEAVGLWTYEL